MAGPEVIPPGPALLYIGTDGTVTQIDTKAVTDRRERRLYRALAGQADELAAEADTADEPKQAPIGFQLVSDTDRLGD